MERALAVDDLEIATAQLELIGDELQQPPRRAGEERTVEEIALLPIEPPREHDPREILGQRDLEVRVRLVVAKEDVVARLVRLDEVVLEEDRFELVVRGDEVDRVDLVDERHRLASRAPFPTRYGVDPVLQVARFADVDDLALGVLVQIDAGAVGQFLDARFEALET